MNIDELNQLKNALGMVFRAHNTADWIAEPTFTLIDAEMARQTAPSEHYIPESSKPFASDVSDIDQQPQPSEDVQRAIEWIDVIQQENRLTPEETGIVNTILAALRAFQAPVGLGKLADDLASQCVSFSTEDERKATEAFESRCTVIPLNPPVGDYDDAVKRMEELRSIVDEHYIAQENIDKAELAYDLSIQCLEFCRKVGGEK